MELNWIKEQLPAHWVLTITVRRIDSKRILETVELENPEGYQVPVPIQISDTLDDMVNNAIELAKEIQAKTWII